MTLRELIQPAVETIPAPQNPYLLSVNSLLEETQFVAKGALSEMSGDNPAWPTEDLEEIAKNYSCLNWLLFKAMELNSEQPVPVEPKIISDYYTKMADLVIQTPSDCLKNRKRLPGNLPEDSLEEVWHQATIQLYSIPFSDRENSILFRLCAKYGCYAEENLRSLFGEYGEQMIIILGEELVIEDNVVDYLGQHGWRCMTTLEAQKPDSLNPDKPPSPTLW